jgi:hypothetical protein
MSERSELIGIAVQVLRDSGHGDVDAAIIGVRLLDSLEPIIRADERRSVLTEMTGPEVFDWLRGQTRADTAEKIAQAIEVGCVHARFVGSRTACYRCVNAAAIAREFKEASDD